MRRIPLVLDDFEYRSKLSSEAMNEKIEAVRDAITTAVLNAQEMNAILRLYRIAELYSSSQKFSDQQAVLSLVQQYLISDKSPAELLYYTSRDLDGVELSSSVSTDAFTGVSYLVPTTLLSKITTFLDELGDRQVHPDVKILIDGVEEPRKSFAYRMLNLNPTDVWVDDTSTAGSTTVTVYHPRSMRETLNYIRVYPFPENGTVVTALEYLAANGAWTAVPGFGFFSGPSEFHFSPVEYADGLRITVQNASYFGRRVWGFRGIELYSATYPSDGEILFTATTKDGTNIANITSFLPKFWNDSSITVGSIEDQPIYFLLEDSVGTVYYDSRIHVFPFTTSEAPIDFSPAASPTLLLRVVMRSNGETSPVFWNAAVTYTT